MTIVVAWWFSAVLTVLKVKRHDCPARVFQRNLTVSCSSSRFGCHDCIYVFVYSLWRLEKIKTRKKSQIAHACSLCYDPLAPCCSACFFLLAYIYIYLIPIIFRYHPVRFFFFCYPRRGRPCHVLGVAILLLRFCCCLCFV